MAFEQNIFSLPQQPKDRKYEKYAFDILLRDITEEEEKINNELFEKCFTFTKPSFMLKVLKNQNGKEKSNDFVNVIKSGLTDFKNDIKIMPDNETKTKQLDRVVDIVEEILEFNEQNQEGQRLKILTSDQLLSRLPISIPKKLRNQTRQLFYCLSRSKKLTKAIY